MKRLYIIVMTLLLSASAKAQHDLTDPRYIYSLDEENYKAKALASWMSLREGEAILFNGRLYKDVNYTRFYYDSGLVNHEVRLCFTRREIKQHTKEKGVKILHVVGEYDPDRKHKMELLKEIMRK